MYTYDKVINAISLNRNELSKQEGYYTFGEAMYEAGMKEVIKEMGSSYYRMNHLQIEKSNIADKSFEEAQRIYMELREILSNEQKEMLYEIFSKMETFAAYSEENGFKEGYFGGYKYVKELDQ